MVRSASRSSAPAPQVLKQEIEFPPQQPSSIDHQEATLSFWEELCQVPEQQWASEHEKGFKVYLYDHEVPRSPYLAVILHSFDVEWIKQTYGGGLYRAQLNDPAGRIVSKEIFAIDGDSKRKPPQNAQAAGVPQQQHAATDSFQSELLRMMREEQAETRRLFSELMNRQNPLPPTAPAAVDPTTLFRGMVEMFKEFMPAQKPMDLLETVALLDKLRGPDLLTTLKAAREAGVIPAAGGGGSMITQFKELKEAAEVLGLGEGKGKSLGEAVIERLPDILEAGGKAMEKYQQIESTRLQTAREVRAIQQRGGAVITQPPQPPVGQMPQHAGAQAHPSTTQAPPPYSSGLEVEAPGTQPTPEAIAQAEQQMVFVKSKIVEAIANGDGGGEIIDFLDKIDKEICNQFAGASVDQLIFFFSSDPVLKKAAALPRFKAVITEIVEELNAPDEQMDPVRPN